MFQQNAPISFTLTHYTDFLESKGKTIYHLTKRQASGNGYASHKARPITAIIIYFHILLGIVLVHGEVDTKDLVRLFPQSHT